MVEGVFVDSAHVPCVTLSGLETLLVESKALLVLCI
jgi:hypothetical protein